MKTMRLYIAIAAILLHLAAASCMGAEGKPYQGGRFQGRIAYSCDGNHNDPDDWAASPVSLAIFAASGLKDRLVHYDYNCILPQTDPEWEKTHAASVLGTAERYGCNQSVFHDCRRDLAGAVASLARAINDSDADNPLWFIVAGPMEVPYLGIQKSDPEKRKFVYCISHSRWNDGFAAKYSFTYNKRSVIALGVNWVQIQDQNRLLSTSAYGRPAKENEWQPWHWMRDSQDSKVRWLWQRMRVSTRPDPSDAGMAYFLVSGDEEPDPAKLKQLIDDHRPPLPLPARKQVRLEAENFQTLEGYELEDRNDRNVSHRLCVRRKGGDSGRIVTRVDEPYMAPRSRYDVDVRYDDDQGGRCQYTLLINGVVQGLAWQSPGKAERWTTHTIEDVEIGVGDTVAVAAVGQPARLDYVQLNERRPNPADR